MSSHSRANIIILFNKNDNENENEDDNEDDNENENGLRGGGYGSDNGSGNDNENDGSALAMLQKRSESGERGRKLMHLL